jgi:CheY-like chemotaxis protein
MNKSDDVEILLVEDNPDDTELTLRALRKNNLANRVVQVKDGAAALDFVFARGEFGGREIANAPKVVILDLKLPKVDGLEVLKEMKADPRTRAIPVVILTSSTQEKDLLESYQLGANSYIVKPVDFDKFVAAVAEIGLYWLLINKPPVL